MGARDLLADLHGAGFSLVADGDRLVIRPASKLTDELREALRNAKPELLSLLKRNTEPSQHNRRHAGTWTEPTMRRFLDRRDRLMRWGWSEPEAERTAERLTVADLDGDDRVVCTDCRYFRPWRCANHRAAEIGSPDLPRELAQQPQRCPGYSQ